MADECPKCEEGLPPWLATFADLMSLLMTFFVLLLSFAEIDAVRFKKMAESMKDAFGVQREIPVTEVVMGTSVIKQEFSPSTIPKPSPINEIRQQTTDVEKQNLDVKDAVDKAQEVMKQQVEEQAEKLQEALKDEIKEGLVTVETQELNIIIRIQEKGSFRSGSADVDPGFHDVMERISDAVSDAPGQVVVAGHTDNIPINTVRFRSNWELSAARAASVVDELLRNPRIDASRVVIEGHADTQPLVPNDSPENRALNRRVEMIIERGQNKESGEPPISVSPGKG